MQAKDILLIIVAFVAMAAGVYMPYLAEPLDGSPRISLMVMLFVSFLGLNTRAVVLEIIRLRERLLVMTVGKLFITPIVTFGLFLLILPDFSLGALLLAGAPVGVVSVFFATVLRADFALSLSATMFTSLVSPFTLPLLTGLVLPFLGYDAAHIAKFSPIHMSIAMCVFILVPYGCSQLVRCIAPKLCAPLMASRFWINLVCIAVSNVAVFAKFSPTLLQNLDMIIPALCATMLCGGVSFLCGAALSWNWPLTQQVSMGVGFGISNGIMSMILATEFFDLAAALPGALFAIPTVLMLVPCRMLIRLRTGAYNIPVQTVP